MLSKCLALENIGGEDKEEEKSLARMKKILTTPKIHIMVLILRFGASCAKIATVSASFPGKWIKCHIWEWRCFRNYKPVHNG